MTHTTSSALAASTSSATAPYQHLVDDVLAQARPLMDRVAEATRMSLQSRLDQARTPGEHHAMLEAKQQLQRLASVMAERYPDALRKALDQETAQADSHKPTRSLFTVHFDDLELMDESQINDSVERARARQVLISAVEGPLADLDALVCAALGLPRVQPEHNPLRPEVFLQALQAVVSQMQVSTQVRHDWIGHMSQALGAELRALYKAQVDRLRHKGLQPVGYAMRQASGEYVYVAPAAAGAAPGFASDNDLSTAASSGDPLLTLDRLRRLLLGEFKDNAAHAQGAAATVASMSVSRDQAGAEAEEDFAERFAREFESPGQLPHLDAPATDFASTVPAAFEALQEMNQVGHMMERLGNNQRAQDSNSHGGGSDGAPARKHATGLGEALSMEVVALMVDNIARDTRLLWPVQQFIRALEPALMQLAVADPRFFSHKEHAARRLLQDITDRSLAFNSTDAPGFQSFMRSLMNLAGPLATATIEGPDDFEHALQQLHANWADKDQQHKQERQRAIETLQHAEQRHRLAAQIARELWLLPDIGKVPDEISRFLMGPWAQVMAQARLTNTSGAHDPGATTGSTAPARYEELVGALVWSTQPALTRASTGQLARLLPPMLATLREGLASIDYPAERTEAVFELLMQLHEQAFKPVPGAAASPEKQPEAPIDVTAVEAISEHGSLDDEDPWVAPAEAKESGYMDVSLSPEPESTAPVSVTTASGMLTLPPLATGMWVNLLVGGEWERTQLSWIGSHGNLFLFTSATGRTQSMTLRLLDRLMQQGALQILTEQNVVDGALDAVAQLAMHNSMESRL
ncbi:MAG: DUF1631 domain-containing protein [Gammaproteobacteria bacterium]|nr:DUF1631 domain-containing protein [Gammaproteobacteria bacterium]